MYKSFIEAIKVSDILGQISLKIFMLIIKFELFDAKLKHSVWSGQDFVFGEKLMLLFTAQKYQKYQILIKKKKQHLNNEININKKNCLLQTHLFRHFFLRVC